jgi:hypothetical protein
MRRGVHSGSDIVLLLRAVRTAQIQHNGFTIRHEECPPHTNKHYQVDNRSLIVGNGLQCRYYDNICSCRVKSQLEDVKWAEKQLNSNIMTSIVGHWEWWLIIFEYWYICAIYWGRRTINNLWMCIYCLTQSLPHTFTTMQRIKSWDTWATTTVIWWIFAQFQFVKIQLVNFYVDWSWPIQFRSSQNWQKEICRKSTEVLLKSFYDDNMREKNQWLVQNCMFETYSLSWQ